MKRKSITGLLIFLSANFGMAQKVMSLKEIIQTVDAANPTARMYDAEIRSLDEAAKGARSWMPTEFGTGFWMTPYAPHLWKKGQNGATGTGQYMISVQQMFPNRKRQNAEAVYLEGMSGPQKERKNAALNELHAEAKTNYYDWMIIKRRLFTLNENERILNLIIRDAEIRYKNGLDKLNAYYKAKAELGIIKNMKLELYSQGNQKRVRLVTLMNRQKQEPFEIDSSFTISDYRAASAADSALVNRRSEIRAIDQELTLTRLQQQSEKARELPEFGLKYDHMFGFGGLPLQYTLMGMVRIPIGAANRTSRANIQSLTWKSAALEQQKQMLLNEASGQILAMVTDLDLKKSQVELFETNIVPALRKNYEVIELGYQQNTEQLSMVLDAWSALNKTEGEYYDQLQQLLNIQVELERILEIK